MNHCDDNCIFLRNADAFIAHLTLVKMTKIYQTNKKNKTSQKKHVHDLPCYSSGLSTQKKLFDLVFFETINKLIPLPQAIQRISLYLFIKVH